MNPGTDDDTTPDPIDQFYNDCIDRNPSTAGTLDCTRQAAAMWDVEMNKAYDKLLILLGPTKSQALRSPGVIRTGDLFGQGHHSEKK